jgi:prophage regulatory protein
MIARSHRSTTARPAAQIEAHDQRIIRSLEVNRRTGLGKTTRWRGVRDGWFPSPVELSPGCVGWLEQEIDDWIANRIADRDGARVIKERSNRAAERIVEQ